MGSLFSTASSQLVACRLSDDGHTDQCEVIPHCSFDLYFSNNYQCWASFHVPTGHLSVCLIQGNVSLGFLTIFIWVVWFILILSWMSCLFILEIKSLSITSCVNMFSQFIGCIFILFMISFAVQKLISFIRPHLFIFAFIPITLGELPKKTLLQFMSEKNFAYILI